MHRKALEFKYADALPRWLVVIILSCHQQMSNVAFIHQHWRDNRFKASAMWDSPKQPGTISKLNASGELSTVDGHPLCGKDTHNAQDNTCTLRAFWYYKPNGVSYPLDGLVVPLNTGSHLCTAGESLSPLKRGQCLIFLSYEHRDLYKNISEIRAPL